MVSEEVSKLSVVGVVEVRKTPVCLFVCLFVLFIDGYGADGPCCVCGASGSRAY